MPANNDPETLKIPAYLRNKAIVSQAKQKLILTALDRKEAGLKPNSKQATAKISGTPRQIPTPKAAPVVDPVNIKPKKMACAGEVTHYLDNINVAIIKTTSALKQGDIILIEGDDYIFAQPIEEMQIDRKPVKRAKKGSHIGLKVAFEAEVNGKIFKF